MKKKREYQSSELVKSFAKIYGFEDKLLALQVKDFLEDYLDYTLFKEIFNDASVKVSHLTKVHFSRTEC